LSVGIALEQRESGKVVGFALKQIRGLGRKRLFAVLKEAERPAVSRKLVVTGLVQFQEILFAVTDGVVDVNDVLIAIVEAEHLRDRCFNAVRSLGGFVPHKR
jgi:hypothetical protein